MSKKNWLLIIELVRDHRFKIWENEKETERFRKQDYLDRLVCIEEELKILANK